MVPVPLMGRNLRSTEGLGRDRWRSFRNKLIEAGQTRCAICGGLDRLQGHEVWEYSDDPHGVSVAQLIRVDIVCSKCHHVMHWGNTNRLFATGQLSRVALLALRAHFRHVNRCRQVDFDRHVERSNAQWRARSIREWRIDWGDFASMVAEAAAARAAYARRQIASDTQPEFVGPGHHMPSQCPSCHAVGALVMVDEDPSEMTEGQRADYEGGIRFTAFCRECGFEFDS
jgi:hypothetical protein